MAALGLDMERGEASLRAVLTASSCRRFPIDSYSCLKVHMIGAGGQRALRGAGARNACLQLYSSFTLPKFAEQLRSGLHAARGQGVAAALPTGRDDLHAGYNNRLAFRSLLARC